MGLDADARIMYVYESTGRAVLFNAMAVGLGFGILTLSAAPPIRMFGILVATAIVGAFVAALTVLPALLKVLGDLTAGKAQSSIASAVRNVTPVIAAAILVGALHSQPVRAQDLEADRI